MDLVKEWLEENVYHTTLCDKERRTLGNPCICGKNKAIAEVTQLRTENERLREFVDGWAGHEADCDCLDVGSPRTDCTCGYEDERQKALNSKQ